jgi:glucose/mannose-6-phosphate isomerase
MNLDDADHRRRIDPQGMLGKIDELPDQVETAWARAGRLPLGDPSAPRHIVFCGMGGSAIGADLACAFARSRSRASLTVWRDYDLPAWAEGADTLVVASSHSGNTEETLSAYQLAKARGARCLVFTSGGTLQSEATAAGDPLWPIEHPGPPRAAVGFSFAFSLGILSRLGLIEDPSDDVARAIAAMREQSAHLKAEVPVVHNPAKRMGGQLMDRWPIFFGGGVLAPVARRWRSQVNELAKAPAEFEELPEGDHNVVTGTLGPQALIGKTMVVFLRAGLDDPRLARRAEATRQVLMVEGFNTDLIDGAGDCLLAQQWTCLHYGDYAAYYLAIAYGVDPTPIPAIENFKEILRSSEG